MSDVPAQPYDVRDGDPGRLMSKDKLTANIAGLTINSPARFILYT